MADQYANMSYCRFNNTALALSECNQAMTEALCGELDRDEFNSDEEYAVAKTAGMNDPIEFMNLSQSEREKMEELVNHALRFLALADGLGLEVDWARHR